MARTTSALVQGILGDDYNGSTNLNPFISTASVVVNRVRLCAIEKEIPLTTEELELLERWLAAHYYCQSDTTYKSKSTGGASGSFRGGDGMGFESTLYGQSAMMNIDPSGCLANLDKTTSAGGVWLGKPDRDKLSWRERN